MKKLFLSSLVLSFLVFSVSSYAEDKSLPILPEVFHKYGLLKFDLKKGGLPKINFYSSAKAFNDEDPEWNN